MGGQATTQSWDGIFSQSGNTVTIKNASYNPLIPAGGTIAGTGFNANWDNVTNPKPNTFTLNGHRCENR
jgi:hypothetical protein